VGTAIASFITLLDIIPRLSQVTDSSKFISIYEKILVISTVSISVFDFFDLSITLNELFAIPIGFMIGSFIGLLAAALAEVVNVLPILQRRLRLNKFSYVLLISISLGKIIGSLFDWLILTNFE